ncbi:hypothetical protein B0A55_05451 [Friedmanniomyces simplex]|uniref:Uncharacterized protein n=1 Tax=Friedmanniomyces simplex TaxID=329884 RepID=A0A4U0XCS9_9PEZI|nr:hypothetical protein B0A55_05451 [Friedmanniomyces simplex]
MLRPIFRLASLRPTTTTTTTAFLKQQPTTLPRPFTSASSLRLKEDGNRTPEELDAKKHEQLEKQKKGEGHWHEDLASSSESHVAADKEEVHDHGEHMEELQKETAGKQEEEHPEGKA